MLKSFIFSILIFFGGIFLIGSCDNFMDDFDENIEIPEKRDPRFLQCYYEEDLAKNKCDSVLISIFGKSTFEKNIRFDLAESSMNCEVESDIQLIPFGDSNYCVPNSYDLRFFVETNGKSIYPFRVVAGSDMEFEVVSTIVRDQLEAYRRYLNGDFRIGYSSARKIALENGVDFNESDLELVKNEGDSLSEQNNYHWEAELEYDDHSVVLLWIDVMSGETSEEVLTMGDIR